MPASEPSSKGMAPGKNGRSVSDVAGPYFSIPCLFPWSALQEPRPSRKKKRLSSMV